MSKTTDHIIEQHNASMVTKCKTSKCNASCCYNVPMECNELERFANMIVNPVLWTMPMGMAVVPFTNDNPSLNKCPFLRRDCKCNIYDNRPEVCRLMGTIDKMPCKFIKRIEK